MNGVETQGLLAFHLDDEALLVEVVVGHAFDGFYGDVSYHFGFILAFTDSYLYVYIFIKLVLL